MNLTIHNCYKILEIKPQADFAEVKRAYHDLVWVWHPDRFPQNERLQQKAHLKLKEINEAYDVLKTHFGKSKPNDYSHNTQTNQTHYNHRDQSTQSKQHQWEQAFGREFTDQHHHERSRRNSPKQFKVNSIYPYIQLVMVLLILIIGIYIYSGALMRSPFIQEEDQISQGWEYFDQLFGESQEQQFSIGNKNSTEPNTNQSLQEQQLDHQITQKQPSFSPEPTTISEKISSTTTTEPKFKLQVDQNEETTLPYQQPTLPPTPTTKSLPTFFSLGSSKQEVILAQGEPERTYTDRITNIEILEYGESRVKLGGINKHVIAWDNQAKNLNINMNLEPITVSKNAFTVNSHKNEVFIIQGVPEKVSSYPEYGYQVWRYGYSSIVFSLNTGRILHINNTDNNLKISYSN